MKNTLGKWLTIIGWLGSWLIIFWINFSAELSLMMHFFAIPVLLLTTAVSMAKLLEDDLKAHDR